MSEPISYWTHLIGANATVRVGVSPRMKMRIREASPTRILSRYGFELLPKGVDVHVEDVCPGWLSSLHVPFEPEVLELHEGSPQVPDCTGKMIGLGATVIGSEHTGSPERGQIGIVLAIDVESNTVRVGRPGRILTFAAKGLSCWTKASGHEPMRWYRRLWTCGNCNRSVGAAYRQSSRDRVAYDLRIEEGTPEPYLCVLCLETMYEFCRTRTMHVLRATPDERAALSLIRTLG